MYRALPALSRAWREALRPTLAQHALLANTQLMKALHCVRTVSLASIGRVRVGVARVLQVPTRIHLARLPASTAPQGSSPAPQLQPVRTAPRIQTAQPLVHVFVMQAICQQVRPVLRVRLAHTGQ